MRDLAATKRVIPILLLMYNKSLYVNMLFSCKIVFVRLSEKIAYPNHPWSQLVRIIHVLLYCIRIIFKLGSNLFGFTADIAKSSQWKIKIDFNFYIQYIGLPQ